MSSRTVEGQLQSSILQICLRLFLKLPTLDKTPRQLEGSSPRLPVWQRFHYRSHRHDFHHTRPHYCCRGLVNFLTPYQLEGSSPSLAAVPLPFPSSRFSPHSPPLLLPRPSLSLAIPLLSQCPPLLLLAHLDTCRDDAAAFIYDLHSTHGLELKVERKRSLLTWRFEECFPQLPFHFPQLQYVVQVLSQSWGVFSTF